MLLTIKQTIEQHSFLFTELVKRDFKRKYKKTVLGIFWSMLNPLLQLLVMVMVFTHFFGANTPHFFVYVFAGQKVFAYFTEGTTGGMMAIQGNADILSKVNAPKYLFLLANNVSAMINFLFTLVIFFILIAVEGIPFHPRFLMFVYPILTLMVFNVGVGMVLSALYVFFKDTSYLYGIVSMTLMWLSAIFYPIHTFSPLVQQLFLLNPVFAHIHYFRLIVLYQQTPSINVHLVLLLYSSVSLLIGTLFYKRFNKTFSYYM